MENIEIQSNTLINVLTNKVNQLTNEGLIKDSLIQELQMKLVKYEDVTPTEENDLKEEE